MTLPCERYRAIKRTREFLYELSKAPSKYSAAEIKAEIGRCLHHYPGDYHLDELASAAPEILSKE